MCLILLLTFINTLFQHNSLTLKHFQHPMRPFSVTKYTCHVISLKFAALPKSYQIRFIQVCLLICVVKNLIHSNGNFRRSEYNTISLKCDQRKLIKKYSV